MNFKLFPLLAGAVLCWGSSAFDASAADYCTSGSLTRTTGGRYLNSLVVSDGTSSVTISVYQGGSSGSATYFDKTTTVLRVQPGATISFPDIKWTGDWMHSYAYVDYNQDGVFNTTLNANGNGSGETVAYSYYNSNTGATTGTDSHGNSYYYGAGVSAANMPSFVLPADLTPGDYRMRFKIDWNSLNPCGSTIEADGGSIVDITLQVEAPRERTITVKSANPVMGSVAISGTDQLSVTQSGAVDIVATPNSGYSFSRWTDDADGSLYSEQASLSIVNNEDLSLTAQFTEFTYPGMFRTFTNNSNQENRYLGRVTTSGTLTPEVFNATSQAQLPYTAFTSSAGTYVSSGALIDKTSTPIRIEKGTRSFDITYYAWTNSINGKASEMGWTQEAYFVDWNRNGSFTDANEISSKGNTTMENTAILSGMTRTVSVPEGIASGTYRMRVVFYEPSSSSDNWQDKLFSTYGRQIRNGIAYDFDIQVLEERDMAITGVTAEHKTGQAAPGYKHVPVAVVKVVADGTRNPISVTGIDMQWTGDDVVENLHWEYSATSAASGTPFHTVGAATAMNRELAYGTNNLILVADIKKDAEIGASLKASITSITLGDNVEPVNMTENAGITIADVIDYTLGNALWFDTPNSSTSGTSVWNTNDFSSTDTNADQLWERKSFPIGNGSFGGNVLGSVNRERVVLNEKTLWKGGPGTGASGYWNMNKTVSSSTLESIRTYLANGNNSSANSLVASNYRGNIDYTKAKFGTYTVMGEAYVSTGINESAVTDYKRIMNMDRSLVVVEFKADGTSYQRRYFVSYPDSVMVWRFTSEGEPQSLTFSFNCPQIINSVTSPAAGSLLYNCKLDNNNMQWALRVMARTNDGGTVTANPTARTITVTGSNDVEFILAGDTDYVMNFNPDMNDNSAFVGVDPVASVNSMIEKAAAKTYDELYDTHYADYSALYNRVDLSINPSETFENLPTPTRLSRYRAGTLDHGLEQQYFQYGRYLLISSSRAGTMPANLQGMWHNNIDGPWRVDYHNNINLQMNYWPATCTNLLECFQPFIDYVRGLVKPGEKTAQAYYGARGWTAEVSTNIFGFTAPLNSTDMSWNYNPTAGPWLTTQIWEYYDYTRDKEWLREIGYPIIKSSANFVSDLLYLHNGTYTSAPSYSPEHGTCDLGATYANAVTREVLKEAITAAELLGDTSSEISEWKDKLNKMYPYQVGRYGQLQEWYKDIDTYNDTHRHTNHLFGLHPGTSINALEDQTLVDACKETLRQRGDDATGWSMGWKLNHWARLLDGNHAYILFQNLLKNGTADNMWDLHPPFQIDGNFGGTAGVSELFLQSHNGVLHLLPALPDAWTEGHISGLRTRGNFTVDIYYSNGELDYATVQSNAGEDCTVYYEGKELTFETVEGARYNVRFDKESDMLTMDELASIGSVAAESGNKVSVSNVADRIVVEVDGDTNGTLSVELFTTVGQLVKSVNVEKADRHVSTSFAAPSPSGVYFVRVNGASISETVKVVVK
ncbi:MAG: glycoside hydrolase N-terminal domain-containing protein [Paramuribaculum sp.]|nr:glycoside hydrolase N-terminal domain-containing protein [Paramuribaculum sp.]